MKHIKLYESFNIGYKENDYIGYKRYLGLPPLIVKIIKYYEKSRQYFIESIEPPNTTYLVNKYELEELNDEQIKELKTLLTSKKYNL